MKRILLNKRQICDLTLLLNCGFYPLTGFNTRADYDNILNHARLQGGQLWPMPITLDVEEHLAQHISMGDQLCLIDHQYRPVAHLTVNDLWMPDKWAECLAVYGTKDPSHPGVHYLLNQSEAVYVGGDVTALRPLLAEDFPKYRQTPDQLRHEFLKREWDRVIGFQTRNPMHRAHFEMTQRAIQKVAGKLLIHPVVGYSKPGDIDYATRVRCYEKILPRYPANTALLSLLPLAMRMAGPREALWHALIRKNYGCTHFIIGRDHAGPGCDQKNRPFYPPEAAKKYVHQYADELGIDIVDFQEMVYVKNLDQYQPVDMVDVTKDAVARISGTELRHRIKNNQSIPHWFSYPDVIEVLREATRRKPLQGLILFFTGLSGSGKTTLARALSQQLNTITQRKITVLDGDEVRMILSTELGFSKDDRNLNVMRIAYVANLIAEHHGIAICAQIAPYAAIRHRIRDMLAASIGFIEIYLSTPLSICEHRDPKGLYSKVRAGHLHHFTGIDDPYEPPLNPDICIDTSQLSVDDSVNRILNHLCSMGYLVKQTQVEVT